MAHAYQLANFTEHIFGSDWPLSCDEANIDTPADSIPNLSDVPKLIRTGRRVAVRFRQTYSLNLAIGVRNDRIPGSDHPHEVIKNITAAVSPGFW
ncbi:MAG: hypothetical protein RL324_2480 [Verrucomicrobiota bacterium]